MYKFARYTALGVGLLSILTGANAADRQVRVYNGTGQAIYELYGSASRGDHLKTSVLQDGEAMQITFEDDDGVCHLNIRAELETGRAIRRPNVDVCNVDSIVVYRSYIMTN